MEIKVLAGLVFSEGREAWTCSKMLFLCRWLSSPCVFVLSSLWTQVRFLATTSLSLPRNRTTFVLPKDSVFLFFLPSNDQKRRLWGVSLWKRYPSSQRAVTLVLYQISVSAKASGSLFFQYPVSPVTSILFL